MLPIINGEERDKPIYFHVPHYSPQGGEPASAIRKGNFKLIFFYEDERIELYDLRNDPEEEKNLSEEMPGKRDELLGDLERWKSNLKAKEPIKNPDYSG